MKPLHLKVILATVILLSIISLGAFKPKSNEVINYQPILIDSFQLLLDESIEKIGKFKPSKSKNKKSAKIDINDPSRMILLQQLQNFTARICGSRQVKYHDITYHIFVANLDSDEIRMHLYNNKKENLFTFSAVKKQLEAMQRKPLMITNAGMFTPNYEPEGLYVEAGSNTYFNLDTIKVKPNTNFYLKPNGVFYIDKSNTPRIDTTECFLSKGLKELQSYKVATQSGPMLVINSKIHPAFIEGSVNLKIRSGVGIIKGSTHKIVFAVTIEESSFYNFALFFHDVFNCDNALFLDGAISKMYLHDLNAIENCGDYGPMISVSRKE